MSIASHFSKSLLQFISERMPMQAMHVKPVLWYLHLLSVLLLLLALPRPHPRPLQCCCCLQWARCHLRSPRWKTLPLASLRQNDNGGIPLQIALASTHPSRGKVLPLLASWSVKVQQQSTTNLNLLT